jgi:hypothetical protein
VGLPTTPSLESVSAHELSSLLANSVIVGIRNTELLTDCLPLETKNKLVLQEEFVFHHFAANGSMFLCGKGGSFSLQRMQLSR